MEDGRYLPTYEKIDGSCDNIPTYTIPIEFQDENLSIYNNRTVFIGDIEVITDIQFMGCKVQMEQRTNKSGRDVFLFSGEYEIESTNQLVGEADQIEYDTEGNVICRGKYKANIVKSGEI